MRTKRINKLLSWLLATAMLLGMLPTAALASDAGAHEHGAAGFAADGRYYTGNCEFVEETAPTDPTDDTYAPAAGENAAGYWACESYAGITVTFSDPTGANEDATARLVPDASQYSESAPVFAGPEDAAFLGWYDAEGNELDLAALRADTTAYALWEGYTAAGTLDLPNANLGQPVTFNFQADTIYLTSPLLERNQGSTAVSISGVIDPQMQLGLNVLTVAPKEYKDWYYLYNGKAEVWVEAGWLGALSGWKDVKNFVISSDQNGNPELWATAGNKQTKIDADGGNLLVHVGWAFAFGNNSDANVEIQYTTDGKTLSTLPAGELLYLFNDPEDMRQYNGNENIAQLTNNMMFFAKAAEGYKPLAGQMVGTGLMDGDVFELADTMQNSNFSYFSDAMAEAQAAGFTREFHYTGSSSFDAGKDGHALRTFTFTAEKMDDFTLTYHQNSDTATGKMEIQTVPYNSTVKVAESGYENPGYLFGGWNTEANGSGTQYAVGDDISNIQKNVVLYAVWTEDTTPKTNFTVEHYFKNGGTYTLSTMGGTTGTFEGTDPTQADILALAGTYVLPVEDTKGLASGGLKNFYFAYKRASAEESNGQWTLKLYYVSIQFFINTNGVPTGEKGSFTPAIPGAVSGVTWDAADHADTARRQYVGRYDDMGADVTESGATLTVSEDAIKAALKGTGLADKYNNGDYTVRWYTVHEGYFIHVDGYLQLKAAPEITYRSNYPAGTLTDLSEVKTATRNTNNETWEHTVLTNAAVNIPAPAGYFFTGWKDSAGNTYQPEAQITVGDNAALSAQWGRTPTYTVTYTLVGDRPDSFAWGINTTEASYEAGKPVKLGTGNTTSMHSDNTKTIPGMWSFSGWKANTDLTVTTGSFPMPAQDVEFTGSFTFTPATIGLYLRQDSKVPGEVTSTSEAMTHDDVEYVKIGSAAFSAALGSTIVSGEEGKSYLSLRADDYATSGQAGFAAADFASITMDGGYAFDDITWYVVKDVSKGGSWHLDGVLTKYVAAYSVTYLPGDFGSFGAETYSGLVWDQSTPDFSGGTPVSTTNGYVFSGWSPSVSEKVAGDAVYTATWERTNAFDYTVEWYYQNADGSYPAASASDTRSGTHAGQGVSVSESDKTPTGGEAGAAYRLNSEKSILSGTISSEETSLTLKIYFDRQHTVTYLPGDFGASADFAGQSFRAYTGEDTPKFRDGAVPVSTTNGYVFNGWSPVPAPVVSGDASYTAQWKATSEFDYTVAYYYQQADGTYSDTPNNSVTRSGAALDQAVSVTDGDKTPSVGYVLDAGRDTGWSGRILADQGLTLEVYFKLQLTVTYLPGQFGSFVPEIHSGLDHGVAIPAFEGQATANGSYVFQGWSPSNEGIVTGNMEFVAQWSYSGGGGTPDPTPNPDPNPNPGPETDIPNNETPLNPAPDGTGETDIEDGVTPLAPNPDLPTTGDGADNGDDEMIIVDGDTPLGNLPQTGTIGKEGDPTVTLGFLALAASMAAAGLYIMASRKREEDEEQV